MGIPVVADRAENQNNKKANKAAANQRAESNARKMYRNASDRIEDGQALLKHYKANQNKVLSGSPVVANTRIPERWTTGANKGLLKVVSEGIRSKLYINTKEYLNPYFPDGKMSGPIIISWYATDYTSAAAATTSVGTKKVTVVTKSGTFWYSKLYSMDMHTRISRLPGLIGDQGRVKRIAAEKLKALGVSANDYYQAGKKKRKKKGKKKQDGHNYANDAISYNVGMVNEAYFSTDAGFSQLVNMMDGGSRPSAVTAGKELWNNSKSNKGMIWLYSGTESDKLSFEAPDRQAANGTYKKYGFQFHYNPTTIQQAWSGSPDVDVTMWTANLEKYNLLGGQTMSTVSFSLTLNRIFDMQYYGKDGLLKPGRRGDKNPYSPMKPTDKDQKKIYEFGTMYDVEFLLSTVLGFKYKSRFRGTTSDIGFMTGRPVDLHLGNSLRYWGYIQSIGLNHVIFDERMVPILSSVDIIFARIPDYKE